MTDANDKAQIERILNIPVPVIVYLAEKELRVEDVMNFAPGSIIEFQKGSDQPLDIYANNQAIGKGEVVKVGETFGIQIKNVLPTKDTIRKLGIKG